MVYRATLDGTPCALKVLRKKGSFARWVYREAVALARVSDPALPRVIEVGEADGRPYLAMELIEGETLAARLTAGLLAEPTALSIADCLLRALASVHAAGLVHRDVKPRNVVLERTGAIRLVDFGFATPFERSSEVELAGTRGYAAPEQFRANARIDGRADLHAVGVVLLECLTGSSLAPSAASLAAGGQGGLLGAEVQRFIAGLTDADPARRYADTSAARADLKLLRAGERCLGPGAYAPSQPAAPLVGRDQELRHIARLLGSARTGSGVVLLIEGPSGCGKTRLLEAARSAWSDLEGGRHVFVASRDGDAPLALLRKLLEAIAIGDGSNAAHAVGEARLRDAAGSDLGQLAVFIAPSLGRVFGIHDTENAGTAQVALAEGAVELLVRVSRAAGPLLLVVDDLQWTDPASRDVLLRLAHRIAEVPLALVFASREDGRSSPAFDRLLNLDRSRFEVVRPSPLIGRDVEELIRVHLGYEELDQALVRRVESLAGRLPLNILEILRAFLDTGALRPKGGGWAFDPARAESVALPGDAMAGLDRRMGELPPASRSVLEHAAVLGAQFDDGLLAETLGLSADDVAFALADARRAALIQSDEPGYHRFVHDSIRELSLRNVDADVRQQIHQRVGEALDRRGCSSYEETCAVAWHYASGQLEKSPLRVHQVARAAGDGALERFDNDAALRCFELARRAAQLGGATLPWDFELAVGEAQLRLGSLGESHRAFDASLRAARDSRERAVVLGRIAWAYQVASDPDAAWQTLQLAFEAVDARLPVERPLSLGDTLVRAARWGFNRFRGQDPGPVADATLLSRLHYQNARLGFEHGRPLRALQSTLHALELAQHLGPSSELARATALLGFFRTVAMRDAAGGRSSLDRAASMAETLGDQVTVAFALQLRALAACFAGDFDEALRALELYLGKQGHWVELTEYCLSAANADMIEGLRGKPLAAHAWIQRATDRVRRSDQMPAVFRDYLVFRLRADLSALGCAPDPLDTWLTRELAVASTGNIATARIHRLSSWGPRARALFETGELGEPFEELVASFASEAPNPRFAHPMLAEYYIVVGHARVEQLLVGRDVREKLERALSDLRIAAKLPLFKAHRLLLEAWAAWFDGSASNARTLAARAQRLAEEQSCPWVTSGCARLCAHILRAEGHTDSAVDQAKTAILLALEHGAEPRAALIRREFALPEPVIAGGPEGTISRSSQQTPTKKQLAALLAVVRAGALDLRPEPQAVAILDELLVALDGSRATIWFQPDMARRGKLVVSRSREGKTWYGVDGFREILLRQLIQDQAVSTVGFTSAQNVIAVPFSLYGQAVGALSIEREAGPSFTSESRELLEVLLHQVPLALELAGLLSERERLQTSLQRAQKMEAVGRLAGGVAHDFNNMLAAMGGSLETLARHATDKTRFSIDIIQQSVERATRMTKQLLTFSRHSPLKPAACSVGQVILGIEAMLTTVVGKLVTLEITLADESDLVRADSSALEQALVNLAVNARDAMPDGGTLRISTVLEEINEASPGLAPGRYVSIIVTDTGEGMSDETLDRVFEPFFTTKAEGIGTGLGLTTVYAFAKGAGGHIDVDSELAKGTTFRISIPTLVARAASDTAPPRSAESPPSTAAQSATVAVRRGILIVDDESVIRSYLATFLSEAGYRIFLAKNGAEALEAAERHGREIGLAIVDVRMPGMSGPALVKRLREQRHGFRVLFMTGFSPEPLSLDGGEPVEFLEKPFSSERLMERIDAAFSERVTNRTAG